MTGGRVAELRGRRVLALVTTLVWALLDETQWIPAAKVTLLLYHSKEKVVTVHRVAADEQLACCSVCSADPLNMYCLKCLTAFNLAVIKRKCTSVCRYYFLRL